MVLLQDVQHQCVFGTRGNSPCPVGDRQWHLAQDDFHHSEVLQVVMRLKQSIAGIELDQYAANREEVTRERPAKTCIMLVLNDLGHITLTENDFRRSIMPRTDNARMKLVVERCTTEINQPNLGVPQNVL